MKWFVLIFSLTFGIGACKESLKIEKSSLNKPALNNTDNHIKAMSVWYQLIEAGKNKDKKAFSKLSSDTISVKGKQICIEEFIKSESSEFFSDLLFNRIKDTSRIDIINQDLIAEYYPTSLLSEVSVYNNTFKITRFQIDLNDTYPYILAFDLAETQQGYKFISCDIYGGSHEK